MKQHVRRALGAIALAAVGLLGSGCTTTLVVVHLVDQLTLGDPTACHKLNSVERALTPRCGDFRPGSLQPADVAASGLPRCPLALAAREPRLWPVLPELIAKGGVPEACSESPWATLAQADACPDFSRATAAERDALRWLAEADPRAVQHDVVRVLSCPNARAAGLASVLDDWAGRGQFAKQELGFGPLGALHPSALHTPLARALEAQGHTAAAALGGYDGRLPGGFELALRSGDLDALGWWLQRQPSLANRVPPARGDQLSWVPLARALTPSFMADDDRRRETVEFLLAHGADPWRTLPHDASLTVLAYAQRLKSPLAPLLEAPGTARSTRVATSPAAVAR